MFTSSWGEVAWPIEHAVDAARWIASKGLAVLGGEAWWVDERGAISGLIPLRDTDVPAVRHWSAADRGQAEPWRDFVDRCVREALAALQAEEADGVRSIPDSVRIGVRYNISFSADE